MTYPRIIGIGETVLDILFKSDQPQAAIPGGSTFNSIISLGRARCCCAIVTEVGDDHVGDITCRYLTDNHVSTDYVCRHKGVKSHVSLAFLDEKNDAHYQFYKDHAGVTLGGPVPVMQTSDIVLFGSFFAINPSIRQQVAALLREAYDVGAFLYYDINFRKPHVADLPIVFPNVLENMRLATIVRGSTEDFLYLLGEKLTPEAIYERVKPYCSYLILTDGPGEIHLFTPSFCTTFSAPSISTVSTVGAGDNFNAGFLYALSHLPQPADMMPHALAEAETDASRQKKMLATCSVDTWQSLIDMAQSWAQNVCQQMGNSISTDFADSL